MLNAEKSFPIPCPSLPPPPTRHLAFRTLAGGDWMRLGSIIVMVMMMMVIIVIIAAAIVVRFVFSSPFPSSSPFSLNFFFSFNNSLKFFFSICFLPLLFAFLFYFFSSFLLILSSLAVHLHIGKMKI